MRIFDISKYLVSLLKIIITIIFIVKYLVCALFVQSLLSRLCIIGVTAMYHAYLMYNNCSVYHSLSKHTFSLGYVLGKGIVLEQFAFGERYAYKNIGCTITCTMYISVT